MRSAAAALIALFGAAAAGAQLPPGQASREAPRGQVKAQMCATCHGPLGISNMPDAPHLAGQPRIYVVQQMRAFRSGKRVHEVMNVVAKPLTDADIDALADWYASLEVVAREKR